MEAPASDVRRIPPRESRGSAPEVFRAALRLGLTSFGGPIAHIGYFRNAYVVRLRWLDDERFTGLVALCQLLPGPASSQLGMAIGTHRAGIRGGLAAWLGFTLPSAILLGAFAAVIGANDGPLGGWLHGLEIGAAAVVGSALVAMARPLTRSRRAATLATGAAIVALASTAAAAQVAIIAAGGALGAAVLVPRLAGSGEVGGDAAHHPDHLPSRRTGIACLAAFAILLAGLPIARATGWGGATLDLVDALYRSGALLFGGGHAILPLLHGAVVDPGWVRNDTFLAGYGAAQAVPGPLFSVATFLGWVASVGPGGPFGGAIALVAIYLPSFLLVFAALARWGVPASARVRGALAGANASVIGILAAAWFGTVLPAAIHAPTDAVLVALGAGALLVTRVPPIVVVGAAALLAHLAGT